jgi:hypothetical protein
MPSNDGKVMNEDNTKPLKKVTARKTSILGGLK